MACGGSAPNWTAATWADIQSCHTSAGASDGDTIHLTGSAYDANSQLAITKYVKVVCDGTCDITDNICAGVCGSGFSDSLILITGNDTGNTEFGGSGFHFVLGTSRHANPSAVINVQDYGTKPVVLKGMYNTGCSSFGEPYCFDGNFIHIQGTRAVVTGFDIEAFVGGGNCFNGAAFLRQDWDGTGWTQISKFGDADTNGDWKIYVEGNTLTNVLEALDLNAGTRMAVRFNTFTNSAIIHHGSDTQTYGGRYSEIYSNTFIRDNDPYCGADAVNGNGHIGFRGGTSILVNNSISTYPSTWGPKANISAALENIWRLTDGGRWKCWGTINNPDGFTGTPNPYQIGWGWINGSTQAGNAELEDMSPVMMDREPLIIAGNSGGGNYDDLSLSTYTSDECSSSEDVTNYVHINLEYYQQVVGGVQTSASSPFTGANAGTGYGTWENRPTSCTDGRYYWATNQGGHWDTTSGNSNDGALYKCASNVWELFYTPYPYPHVLVGGPAPSTRKSKRGKISRGRH